MPVRLYYAESFEKVIKNLKKMQNTEMMFQNFCILHYYFCIIFYTLPPRLCTFSALNVFHVPFSMAFCILFIKWL